MPDTNPGRVRPPADRYPRTIIFIRWALLAVEGALAVYFVNTIRTELAVMFVAYGVVCLFLLLPLIRCVRCHYYGRRCNFGWGTWVARIFPRDEVNSQSAFYGYTILFWPLRMLPMLLGIRDIIGIIAGVIMTGVFKFSMLVPLAYFAVYLAIIALHRQFYRAASCPRCHERLSCPVYNSRVMLIDARRGENVHEQAA